MCGLLGYDILAERFWVQKKKKIKTLRKSPLKLSIYVRSCAVLTHKNKCFIYIYGKRFTKYLHVT